MDGWLNAIGAKVAAIGTAAAAAAGVATWVAVSRSTPPAEAPAREQPAADKSTEDIVVCVGADAVFRLPGGSGECRSGERRIVLAPRDAKVKDAGCIGCDPWEPKRGGQEGPLADIERRIDALEHAPVFEVIDRRGRLVFSVAPQRVLLFNSAEVPVVGMLASGRGGVIKGQSADAARLVSFGAGGASGGLRIEEAGVVRLDLGRQPAGNYSLRFPKGDGLLAGIGESRAGSGALLIGDREGRLRISMQIADERGAASVLNADGVAVTSLSEGPGGGRLSIADGKGEGMVKIGVNGGRYGVVLAGPRAGFPLVPKSGLPGSYFLGCAGGEGCTP